MRKINLEELISLSEFTQLVTAELGSPSHLVLTTVPPGFLGASLSIYARAGLWGTSNGGLKLLLMRKLRPREENEAFRGPTFTLFVSVIS